MKKIIEACIFCIIIFCACTADKNRNISSRPTGSSIESNTTGSIVAASGSMVSVTEAAMKSDKSKKIHTDNISTLRYANDKNIYLGDGDQKIYQYDLSGRRQRCYDLGKELGKNKKDYYWVEVLWVDNDEVFFSCYRKEDYYEIWRIPLTKEKKCFVMSGKEKITKVGRLDGFVTKTDGEIIYSADSEIYKMDIKTKQNQELRIGFGGIMKDQQGIPFLQNNKIYYEDSKSDMYQMDLEECKPVYIASKGGIVNTIETDGSNIYFETKDEGSDESHFSIAYTELEQWIARYDLQSGKKVKLFSQKKIRAEVDKLGTTMKSFSHKINWAEWDDFNIKAIYYYENRLYIAVYVTSGYDWDAWIMFSCQVSDGSDFRFEKEVTEYLWKNSIPYKDDVDDEDGDEAESCDPIIWDLKHVTGEFLYYLDGCIVMHFYDKKAKGDEDAHHRFVVYDISTGTFKKIEKYSEEYGYFKALGFSETSELVR